MFIVRVVGVSKIFKLLSGGTTEGANFRASYDKDDVAVITFQQKFGVL